jgi:hypothetical protein
VTVRVRGEPPVRLSGEPRLRGAQGVYSARRERVRGGSGRYAFVGVPIQARATAELLPDMEAGGVPHHACGGDTTARSPTTRAKPIRPDAALAFDRIAPAAREEAGLFLIVSSGFRSDAERARLFAAHPDPKWVARAKACTATAPSSTSARPPPTAGLQPTPTGSASFRGTPWVFANSASIDRRGGTIGLDPLDEVRPQISR